MNFIPQHDQMDCGPACLSMISTHYNKRYTLKYLRENSYLTRDGVSLLGIIEAAENIGFDTLSVKITLSGLIEENELLPAILHWNQNHFVVLSRISKNIFTKKYSFHLADPAHGFIKLSEDNLKKSWQSEGENGIVLYLKPTEKFHESKPFIEENFTLKYLFAYLIPYKKQFILMFALLLLGSAVTLIFPFLTQNLIDKGVNVKNLNYIKIILLAQLSLFLGSMLINIYRNWLLLFVGTHVSITIISDFFKKMLQLPIKFFDTKLMGDFNQRIQDNERIEDFLTSQSLITFFSIITFSVFFGVLWYYDVKILIIYLLLTILSVSWSLFWLKKRKILDYFRFQLRGENQESIYEMLNGVTEMKLNQFDEFKRNQWEIIQKKLFKNNIRILKIDQLQLSGFDFLNQVKNILVTFFAATYVVENKMTLGALMSVSYIIGQMNSPVNQLVGFFRSLQDAKLSLDRLNEVQNNETEENSYLKKIPFNEKNKKNKTQNGISIQNLSFQYEGPKSPFVLKDINLFIPEGKITAIVGASGSGKTTLMKLLLRFYNPVLGQIFFNEMNILEISPKNIRENTGVVMQDGFIFSDSIERNIATKDEVIDKKTLKKSIKIAHLEEFTKSLPLHFKTKIGAAGNGISGGQKQRILIARAVYKNPQYIFFDEATSALDAENEKIIHDNLQEFFKGKTVLIIAHRLSTVKNGDQIIVLKNGKIVEIGNHQELVALKNEYFNLVKNQLELGS